MLGQWVLELNHVAAIVGGFNSQEKYAGQEGVLFNPIPKARQVEAVKFLNDNAFVTPAWAIDQEILRRIEPIGELSRIRNAQNSVLNSLLNSARFARLVEQEATEAESAYSPANFLADVRKGVWKEIDAPQVKIDAYSRNLQRAYLDLVNNKLNGPAVTIPVGLPPGLGAMFASSGDEKSLYRAELSSLSTALGTAITKAADKSTRAHLPGARNEIAKILDPNVVAPSNNGAPGLRIIGEQSCWPDYVVEP